jgi:hypothetical protein
MNRLKFALASIMIASPAVALAQGEGEAEPPAEGSEVDPNAGGDMGASTGGEMPTTMSTSGWSKSAIDRPYFRGTGKITAGGDLSILKVSFPDPTGMTSGASFTLDFITLRAAYGVTDQISVGLNYALSLGLGDGDFEAAGPLTLWGGYQIKHDAKLSLAATGAFSIDVDDTDTKAIGLGLGVRYTVAPKIGVFTGAPYGPGAVGGSGFGGAAGQLFGGGHLSIELNGQDLAPSPITFGIPVGAMYQATPELNINVSTNLGSIAINEDAGDSVFFGADFIPLSIGGLFAVNDMIDATFNLALPDLKEDQFDVFVITVGARAHL